MKNYHDALRDYNKCIGIDPTIPTAYYGKAKIHILREEWNEAIVNLDESIKNQLPFKLYIGNPENLKLNAIFNLKNGKRQHLI